MHAAFSKQRMGNTFVVVSVCDRERGEGGKEGEIIM